MAISTGVASNHVWQLAVERDPTATLETTEYAIALRCSRLPRPVNIKLPGEPLDVVWKRAVAMFVAAQDDVVGGYLVLTAADERPAATIARLVVAPPLRRRGTARALVRTAAQWAAAEGMTTLLGHCSARNHPAATLYTRLGFTFCGYSDTYYPRNELALFWQRKL